MIWEGNNPEESKSYTYSELLNEVSKFANVLKSKNVKKGANVAGKAVKGIARVGGRIFLPLAAAMSIFDAAKGVAKVGGIAGKIFGKAAKFIVPGLKAAKPIASKVLGKIPILGPIVVAVISILTGDPPVLTLF